MKAGSLCCLSWTQTWSKPSSLRKATLSSSTEMWERNILSERLATKKQPHFLLKSAFVCVCVCAQFVGPKSYLAKGLPLLKDEDWKRVHRIVSTTFSSGRIKEVCKNIKIPWCITAIPKHHCVSFFFVFGQMFPIMLRHSSNLIRNFHRLEDHEAVDIKK